MKKSRLEIKTTILRQIDALPGRYRQRVRQTIAELAVNPRPQIAQPLRTFSNRYRIRLDVRIVYRIEDDLLIVEIVKVGRKHGPEFYDNI